MNDFVERAKECEELAAFTGWILGVTAVWLVLSLAATLMGCAAVHPPPPVVPPEAPPPIIVVPPPIIPPEPPPVITNAPVALGQHLAVRGVFFGLTATSPDGDHPCPGCDVDARTLAADAESEGVTAVTGINSACTWAKVKATCMAMADGLGRGDMLVIGLSGHGTQLPDDNGDEADGIDEGLCLYASDITQEIDVVRDDRVLSELLLPLWRKHPGLDIMLITDTCFSQGNFRALWRYVTRADPRQLELFGKSELDRITAVDGGLIQIAMCREDQYSYGDATGGTGTQKLLAVRRGDIGRKAAYRAMLPLIDTEQNPQWVEFGTVSEMFRKGRFWK